MIYDYMCNKCEHKYTKSNTIEHRKKSGRCPKCTSKDTKKIMSTPMFRTAGTGHATNDWNGLGKLK
jgi:putative FmdB family regulatory protein